MTVQDFCRDNLTTIEPNATLLDAARLMKERHVGDLVVIDGVGGGKHPAGIITDRDIVLAVCDGQALAAKRVDAVMTRTLLTAPCDAETRHLIALMRTRGVRRVPLVDPTDGTLVGVVSADDLYQALSAELADLAAIGDRQVAREGAPKSLMQRSQPPVFV